MELDDSITLPYTFNMDAMELDDDYLRGPDKNRREFYDITIQDQLSIEGEQYISITINENIINGTPTFMHLNQDLTPIEEDPLPQNEDQPGDSIGHIETYINAGSSVPEYYVEKDDTFPPFEDEPGDFDPNNLRNQLIGTNQVPTNDITEDAELSIHSATKKSLITYYRRGKVIDISEDTLTIEVTGDPGKMAAIQRNLSRFGIIEIARTGKIALRREKMGKSAPFWRFCATSYPDLECSDECSAVQSLKSTNGFINGDSNGASDSLGDVYPVEPYKEFSMNKVLDANWGICYKEDSLACGSAEMEGTSRITTVIPGTDESIGKLIQQLYKLIDVCEVKDLTYAPFAEREMMLIKVAVNASARRDILDIADIFRAKAVDVCDHTITLLLTGDINKMAGLQRLLEPFGICEVARTGRVALARASGVDSSYLRGYSLRL